MRLKFLQSLIDILRGKHKLIDSADIERFKLYFYNYHITNFPSQRLRQFYLKKVLKYNISDSAFIYLGCYFYGNNIEIGDDTVIGRNCTISGNVKIGKHCSITAETFIQTSSHLLNSPMFEGCDHSIVIGDYVWIGVRSVIVPGVEKIGDGAVVGANSTVTKNVDDYSVVAGSPAKEIKKRDKEACCYTLNYHPAFN